VPPVLTLADHARLVAGLERALAARGDVRVIETHISSVLLAGADAYKLKKPLALDFLDFSTLAARRRACEDELRLNRRTAPALYRAVLSVIGTLAAPALVPAGDEHGDVLDVALLMRRFDPAQVLDQLAARGALPLAAMAPLGRTVAQLHAEAVVAPAGSDYGSVTSVRTWTERTVQSLRAHIQAPADRARVDALAQWAEHELQRQAALIAARQAGGRVRECHGDLHLGNIVLLDGAAVPFDALEFNAALRFIDVMSDVAFLWMDLNDHALPAHAASVLDAWVEASGDADGLPLLRGFAVYRALVRALVAELRAQQPGTPVAGRVRAHASCADYLALAERLRVPQPALVVMTGLSGSGKSTIAARLAQGLGGIRVRSDVERKRLAGLDWQRHAVGSAESAPQLYSAAMTARTYERLHAVARAALAGGLPVVVDAASLRAAERESLLALADALPAPAVIVECTAPLPVLRQRVAARAAQGNDPSDATLAVLEAQRTWREPPDAAEAARLLQVDTSASPAAQAAACAAVLARLLHARGAGTGR
jgi:aminoglycoside phosphotransferase family enzyme/predicted kinase